MRELSSNNKVKLFFIKLVSYLLRGYFVNIFLVLPHKNHTHTHAHRQFLFYSGLIGNAIQILQISKSWVSQEKVCSWLKDKGEASEIKRKAGRPSLSSSHQTSDGLTTRSKSEPYIKESCIICQVPGGSVGKVELEQLETTCLRCQGNYRIKDKGFFRRLNEITKTENAVPNDVVYHNRYCAIRDLKSAHHKKKMIASAILYEKLKL